MLRCGRTGFHAGGQLRGREDVPSDKVGLIESLGDTFSTVGSAVSVRSSLRRGY